jgi:hypothetical protein
MGFWLNLALFWPFGGCQVFFNNNLVTANCFPYQPSGCHVFFLIYLVATRSWYACF